MPKGCMRRKALRFSALLPARSANDRLPENRMLTPDGRTIMNATIAA